MSLGVAEGFLADSMSACFPCRAGAKPSVTSVCPGCITSCLHGDGAWENEMCMIGGGCSVLVTVCVLLIPSCSTSNLKMHIESILFILCVCHMNPLLCLEARLKMDQAMLKI